MTNKQWNCLWAECETLQKSDKIKAIVSNGNDQSIYGMKLDNIISIRHLIAIKLYTDYTQQCKRFCTAFRLKKLARNSYETITSLAHRNRQFANWAKLLVECVQCYGQLLIARNNKYYRGIDREFIFPRFIARFHAPLSTTTKFRKAVEFADGAAGIVIELRKYSDVTDVSCFDCSYISDFDSEREVLFFGGDSILEISSICQWYKNIWTQYRKYLKAILCITELIKGIIGIQEISANTKILMHDMVQYTLDSERESPLPPYIETLLNYQLDHMPKQIICNFEEIVSDSQIFVRLVRGEQGPDTLNIANVCNFFRNCDHIIFDMPDRFIMNDEHCKVLIEDIKKILNIHIKLTFEWTNMLVPLKNQAIMDKYKKQFDSIPTNRNYGIMSIIITKTCYPTCKECAEDIVGLTVSVLQDIDRKEDIDGLIASALQDIEIKEGMNDTQTNSNKNDDQNHLNNSHEMVHSRPKFTARINLSSTGSNETNQSIVSTTPPLCTPHVQNISTAKQSLQNLKSCLKKIGDILSEVDEDKNGEIDYEEFQEGLRNIDSNLLPNEIEQIYQHFVWDEFEELNIKLFVNFLFQRCKKNETLKNTTISPKYILHIAFKSDEFRDKSSPSISNLPTTHANKLNKIYEILTEKDDNDDLFIDWEEFAEAMIDLGVKMSRNNLKIIYKILIEKQEKYPIFIHPFYILNNNNKELNIKTFMFPLSTLKCIDSMEANQIIKQYFEPMIPIKKKIFNH